MYITDNILCFKVGLGNHPGESPNEISLLQKFMETFRLISPKITSCLTSHNLKILKIEIFSNPCKI